MSAASLVRSLTTTLDHRRWGTAWQMAVYRDGEQIAEFADGVDGMGMPVAEDSLFTIYCAGKPLVALAIGVLCDEGELSLDDVLGDVIDGDLAPGLRTITIEDLLSHRAGTGHLAPEDFVTRRGSRERYVRQIEPDPPTSTSVYSEFAAWELLRYVVEELSGRDVETQLCETVLRPIGLDHDVALSLKGDDPRTTRLRINVDLQRGVATPLVWERHPANLADVQVATGAIASMSALARLYDHLATILRRSCDGIITAPMLARLVEPATQYGMDPVLGRECQFSRGFMIDLGRHCYSPRHSRASFGHSGMHGMTFAGAEPQTGLAYALHLNGVTAHDSMTDLDRSPQARRIELSDRIVSECAETAHTRRSPELSHVSS